MGAVHPSKAHCFAPNKPTRIHARAHRSSRSLTDILKLQNLEGKSTEGEVVVLGEQDFQGSNLKELLERQPHITHVRFGVGEKHDQRPTWIPMDSDLVQLTSLRSLTSLDLTGCSEITRNGLTHFSLEPHKIKRLTLDDCARISNKFFDHIVHFSRLEQLNLRGCFRISDDGVSALRVLKHLRHLDISLCATAQAEKLSQQWESPTITDAALQTLSRMTQLETLQLEACTSMTDEGLLHLSTLRHLTRLNLAKTHMTDRSLKILRFFPELVSLNVSGCRQISETELLQQLKHVHRLKCLNVSQCTAVMDTFVQALVKNHPLTLLNISGCHQITDKAFHHLAKMRTLTDLHANACPGITKNALSFLASLSELRALHLSGVLDLDCSGVLPFTQLHHLEMSCRSAEDEELSQLSSLKHLTDLTLHIADGSYDERPICIKVLGVRVQLTRSGALTS